MAERVKAKYVCKNTMQVGNTVTFEAGKEYECEYEEWTFKAGHQINGGHRYYWATGEDGKKQQFERQYFKAVFHTEHEKRDIAIDEILRK